MKEDMEKSIGFMFIVMLESMGIWRLIDLQEKPLKDA